MAYPLDISIISGKPSLLSDPRRLQRVKFRTPTRDGLRLRELTCIAPAGDPRHYGETSVLVGSVLWERIAARQRYFAYTTARALPTGVRVASWRESPHPQP